MGTTEALLLKIGLSGLLNWWQKRKARKQAKRAVKAVRGE